MLLLAYRPDAATLSRARLLAWCRAVAAAGMDSVTPPGLVVTLTPPSLPWSFEPQVIADDRRTRGGVLFSRIHYTARQGAFAFANVDESELPSWQAWHDATLGGRFPFVIEFREARYVVDAPGPFPLAMTRAGKWGGQMTVFECVW